MTEPFLDRLVFAATLGPFRHFNWCSGSWFVCFLLLTIWSFRYLRLPISL